MAGCGAGADWGATGLACGGGAGGPVPRGGAATLDLNRGGAAGCTAAGLTGMAWQGAGAVGARPGAAAPLRSTSVGLTGTA